MASMYFRAAEFLSTATPVRNASVIHISSLHRQLAHVLISQPLEPPPAVEQLDRDAKSRLVGVRFRGVGVGVRVRVVRAWG